MKYLADMTWQDVNDITIKTDKILVPIGSFEQHGPHLPLSTDTIIAFEVAKRVAEKLDLALIPPINFGFSIEHMGFSGSVTLKPLTLIKIFEDVCSSLAQSGFKKFFIINGHGGNRAIIESTIQLLKSQLNISIYSFSILSMMGSIFDKLRESPKGHSGHADELETSLILAICPEKVKMEKCEDEFPRYPPHMDLEFLDKGYSFAWQTKEVSKSGVIGSPSKASLKKGKLILDAIVEEISSILKDL